TPESPCRPTPRTGGAMTNTVVYAEPSSPTYPGHMVVGQKLRGGPPAYYGYRFDPAELPQEVRSPEHWLGYLLSHPVPGHVADETGYVSFLVNDGGRVYYEKRVSSPADITSVLPPVKQWVGFARYSFNPDSFHTPQDPCYNCVAWATEIANRLVAGLLAPVRQGRVSLILPQLQKPTSFGRRYRWTRGSCSTPLTPTP